MCSYWELVPNFILVLSVTSLRQGETWLSLSTCISVFVKSLNTHSFRIVTAIPLWETNLLIQYLCRFLFVFSLICCFCSVPHLCPTLCDPMDCSTPGFPVLHHLPELAQTHVIESVMPSNHLILCCSPLRLPSILHNPLKIPFPVVFPHPPCASLPHLHPFQVQL